MQFGRCPDIICIIKMHSQQLKFQQLTHKLMKTKQEADHPLSNITYMRIRLSFLNKKWFHKYL